MDKELQKTKQIVTFLLAEEQYGIDIMQTQEIIKMLNIIPVPNSLSFVEGVINLRGNVIPIIDLKKRFNIMGTEDTRDVIVVPLKDIVLGVMVDRILKVMSFDEADILPPPPVVSGIGREYIQGVARTESRLIIILDIDKLFSPPELAGIKP